MRRAAKTWTREAATAADVKSDSTGPAPTELSAWVLERARDILHCNAPTLVPVEQDPGDGGEALGAFTRRELRIAPDGTHLAWTATRRTDTVMLVSDLTRVANDADWSSLR